MVFTLIRDEPLFIDKNYPGRGHRINILTPQYREIGAGLAYGPYTSGSSTYTHTFMVTCDFGTSRLQPCPYILGVVYDDFDKDAFYDAGEGLEGVFIEILESAGSTETMSAGGYALPVEPGTYTVAARLSQGGSVEKKVTITDQNVKVDFLKSEFNITEPAPCCSVSQDLGIIVPCAVYTGSRETLYMALKLEYAQSKQTGTAMYWSLKNAEILEKTANCSHTEISPDLNITIFCAQLNDLSLSLELNYLGQDSQGDFIWSLHDFTVID